MKPFFFLLFSVFHLASYAQSEDKILTEVISNLSSIETVNYQSTIEGIENGKIIFNSVDTVSFEFQADTSGSLKYRIYSDMGELIYNGVESMHTLMSEKIILTSEDNSAERIHNPLMLSLYSVKKVLPKLVNNPEVKISIEKDTIVNGRSYFIFKFQMGHDYIDWISYELKHTHEVSDFSLWVDEASNLPYKLILPNGPDGSMSFRMEQVELNVKFDSKIWTGETLPKDFVKFTEDEYYQRLKNSRLNSIGQQMESWALPELNSEKEVDLSSLKGEVVLLEFWFKNCGGCISAIPKLNEIKARFENQKFRIYGIEFVEMAPKAELEEYLQYRKILYPNLHMGKKMAAEFGIVGGPTFMVLDKSGKIIHIKTGYSAEAMDEIIEIIEKHI